MEKMTHAEAAALGLKYFYNGKPCPKGHIAERYTKRSHCVLCCRAATRAHVATNRDNVNKRRRDRYAIDPTKVKDQVRNWRTVDPRRGLLLGAKKRARLARVAFDLVLEDIVIPERCPALGILLEPSTRTHQPGSPTLDRIVPERGYIRGNVAVISHRANTIKQNASAVELARVAAWVASVAS